MDDGSIYERQERFMRFLQPWHIWSITLICLLGGAALKFGAGPHQLDGPEALANADIAREITSGHGFQTRVLTPLSLSYITPNGVSAPDVEYPPLFALLLATLAFPLRTSAGAAAATTAALHILTAISLFVWTLKISRDLRIACMAALVYSLSPLALDSLASARPASLTALLVTNLVLWLIYYTTVHPAASTVPASDKPRRPWVTPLILGVLSGLAILADYRMIFLTLISAIVIWRCLPRASFKMAGIFLLGAAVTLVPWALRNSHVAGSPFFSLYWARALIATSPFPGLSLYCRALNAGETLSHLAWQYNSEIFSRSFEALSGILSALPVQLGAAFFALTMVGYCARLISGRIAGITLSAIAVILCTAAVWARQADGTLAALPLLAYIAAIAWVAVLDKLSPPPAPKPDGIMTRALSAPRFHAFAFLVIAIIGFMSAVPWRAPRVSDRRDVMALAEILHRASDPLPKCTMTDIPWDLTWYTGAVTCALPVKTSQVAQLNQKVPMPLIALSAATAQLRPDSYLSDWLLAAIKPGALPGYRIVHRSPVAVLLVDSSIKLGEAKQGQPTSPATAGGPTKKP